MRLQRSIGAAVCLWCFLAPCRGGWCDSTVVLERPVVMREVAEQVIGHTGYMVSYNRDTRIANWVAYELTAGEAEGGLPRKGSFRPDPAVRGRQAADGDYRRSGWDRGHLAPAGDMKWSEEAMSESFYLTNVCPQSPGLNRGDWRELEEECRRWAVARGRVYVACGPVVGEDAGRRVIGAGEVTVPEAFYKVVLLPEGEGYAGVGFVFANVGGSRPLESYVCTIDSVEVLTGIDFFPSLPDGVERVVEACGDYPSSRASSAGRSSAM